LFSRIANFVEGEALKDQASETLLNAGPVTLGEVTAASGRHTQGNRLKNRIVC